MPDDSANIKSVRPFNRSPRKLCFDDKTMGWFDQNWGSRSIEIGCGAGLHPILYANQNPMHAHLAFERTKTKFSAFSQRLKSHNLENLRGLNVDALDWLPFHLENESIDHYFFLYPNPYPKEKQANKRWHRSPFFHFVLATLKQNGLVHFATNEKWLAQEISLYCTSHWNLEELCFKEIQYSPSFQPRTHFEKKYLLDGQTCFDLVYKKSL